MQQKGSSYKETAREFEIPQGNKTVAKWERIYLEEGPEGLYIERRDCASTVSGTKKGRPPKLDKKVEEDLIAVVQRLRAENAYLKINALVSERAHRLCQDAAIHMITLWQKIFLDPQNRMHPPGATAHL